MKTTVWILAGSWGAVLLVGVGYALRRWWQERETGATVAEQFKALLPPRSEEDRRRAALGRR